MTIQALLSEFGMKLNFTVVVLTVALMAARIIPVLALTPFLGGETTPTEVKIGLSLALAVILFPVVQERISNVPIAAIPYIALLLKELFIGVALAFIVEMVFEAARAAGHLVDTAAGAAMAQVMVPQLQQQVTIFSSLKFQLSVVLFLTLNGHHVVIQALGDSFLTLPLDQFPAFSAGRWAFFDLIGRVFGHLLLVAVMLSAPALIATFLTDLALGMINRVAPQIQVFFISMSVKPVVAAAVVLLSAHLLLERMQVEFRTMLERLATAIRLLA
ncbi:MAG: flagellar biosynthetic protein FliR [Myxococcaceae bacterium]